MPGKVKQLPTRTHDGGTEPTTDAARVRLRAPDLLRACAILLVMLLHTSGEAAPGPLGTIRPFAWLGVDIFFVLSGYLIGTGLFELVVTGRRMSLARFYANRAFRILPAYLVMLMAYLTVPAIREAPELPPMWRYLSFTLNFGLDFTDAFTHAWSLCVEEHFYLLFPVVVLALARANQPRAAYALAACVLLGGMVLRMLVWERSIAPLLSSRGYDDLMPAYMRALYYPSYARADGLLMGVCLAAIRTFHADRWARAMPARRALPAGVLVTALAIGLIGHRGELQPADAPIVVQSLVGSIFAFPLFALGIVLILSGLIDSEPALARYPLPGASTIAAISYSLYLSHKAVMHLDRQLFGEERLAGIAGLVTYYATSLAVAWLLWRLVEQPMLALRDRIVPRC